MNGRNVFSGFPARVAIAIPLLFGFLPTCLAAGRVMVLYGNPPGRDLSVYDVAANRFGAEQLEGFAEALADARLLYVGQYTGDAAAKIFAAPERAEAVKAFLARGGTLVVDYNGLGGSSARFFADLGLRHPGSTQGDYYEATVAPGAKHAVLAEPNRISGDLGKACGWWTNWGDGFTCLACKKDDPDKAALLVADGVAGKGTVLVTQTFGIFRDEARPAAAKLLFENILTHAFGALPGPGEAIPVYDPYELREPAANPCYLNQAHRARWHLEGAPMRIPAVVGEPIGLERREAPVSICWDSPPDTAPDSVRVFTYAGRELPCQVRLVDAEKRTLEVLTVVDLDSYRQTLLYVYFGPETGTSKAPVPMLSARRLEEGFELFNDRLRVLLAPGRPEIAEIAPLGARVRNELANWAPIDYGRGNQFRSRDGQEMYQASLTENGPVCASVVYIGPDLSVTYTICAGSPAVFYRIEAKNSATVSRFSGWAPGGDGENDTMWYESDEGLKRAVLQTGSFYRPFDDLRPHMKEGWLAFEDTRGEVVGELMDLQQTGRVSPYVHSAHGHTAVISTNLGKRMAQGAFVAARGDHDTVRRTYVAWKNPPAVRLGRPQTPADVPEPHVPVLGEEFLCIQGGIDWFLNTVTLSDPAELAPRLIQEIVARGGNYLIADDRRSDYVAPLLKEAHRQGVGVCLAPRTFPKRESGQRLCPHADHDAYVAAAANAARYGADGYYLVDEFAFPGTCEACRQGVRQTYGTEVPQELDFHRLAEPAMHNWMFFKMEVINDLIRDMTAAVRQHRPDAFVFHVTSPNNHFRLEMYHDLETHSQWVSTNNSDLYSTDLAHTRYMLAYIRGAQGNDRPVFTVNGCMYKPRETALNLRHHLMCGSNALWYFDLTFSRMYPGASGANDDGFRMLRDTGLGDILAHCRPVRYAAVLRSRAGWIDSVRRGEKTGGLVDYEERIRQRVLLRNLPVEILFTRHLTREALNGYRLLILPSQRDLEPSSAQLVSDWVRAGGNVLVEGETVQDPALAELCGVEAGERVGGPADLTGTAQPFAGVVRQVSSSYLRVSSAGTETVARIGGQPAATIRRAGTGAAAYLALLDAPPEVVEPLVRHLAGTPPLTLPPEVAGDIDVTALTDGTRTVVAAYNRQVKESRTFEIALNAIPVAKDARLVEIERGRVSAATQTLSATIAPGSVNFYLLASPADYTVPEGVPASPLKPIQQSLQPGMDFLRLQPTATAGLVLPKKDPAKLYVAVLKNRRSPLEGCDLGAGPIVAKGKYRYLEEISPEEAALLINAVYWLAQH